MPGDKKKNSPKGSPTKKNSPKKSPKGSPTKKNSPKKSPKDDRNTRKNKAKNTIEVPSLTKIKSSVSEHTLNYLEELLTKISNVKRGRELDKKKKLYVYYESSPIIKILENELKNIEKSSSSLGYHFQVEEGKRIITEIRKYIKYVKRKTDKENDHIKEKYILALLE
jgi:hypothetical protein